MLMPGQLVVDHGDDSTSFAVYSLGMDGTLARLSATQHQVLAHLGGLCDAAEITDSFTGLENTDPTGFTGLALQNYTRHDSAGSLQRQVRPEAKRQSP